MIKLRQQLRTTRLEGEDRASIYAPCVQMTAEELPSAEQKLLDPRLTGYMLEASVRIRFWANRAQYERALQNAEKQVLSHVYAEVLQTLSQARSAMYAHDVNAALHIIDKLEQELMTP